MGVLRFESQNTGRRNSLKISFLIFLLISTGLLGYTLAANINLNSGGAVEFGQGVTRTTACDNQVNVTPFSNFVNESGAGSHLLTSLKISGIDSTSDKCSGKTFVIKAYADSGQLNLFNYTDNISNINYNSIEIYDNAGLFSWISGGTDGNDIVNDENVGNPGRDLSDTSFTVNLTSNANPIIRTALASAASIKRITVETYDGRLLNNRILNASQFGIFLTQTNLSLGLNPTESLPGGNFNSTCDLPSCLGYFTVSDWIANITDQDLITLNNVYETSGLTRSQVENAFSIKFTYDPGAEQNVRWKLQLLYFGEPLPFPPVLGSVLGFDGTSGIFVPSEVGEIYIFFSLDGRLQNNNSIGSFIPYGDQPGRNVPVRNMIQIWTYSEKPYYEELG